MTWWRKEAADIVIEIRTVREQLAATLETLRDFEERLRVATERQELLNRQTVRREDKTP